MMDQQELLLNRVETMNWLLLAAFTLAAVMIFNGGFAVAVLVGGMVANLSFIVMKRDLTRLFRGPVEVNKLRLSVKYYKVRLLIKYYLRLSLLAVFLYYLVKYRHIHIFGLLFGLSTVVTSILVVAFGQYRKNTFQTKEAV